MADKSQNVKRRAQNVKSKSDTQKEASKTSSTVGLSVPLFDKAGKSSGTLTLPKELFGAKINAALLRQYLHVYMTNQRQGTVSTKTRSEVRGSTKKIYRQKGTGGARHGARKAPIFVGGGITFGPKPRTLVRNMNKKQKKQALASALSQSMKDKKVTGVADTLLSMEPKTKNFAAFLKNAGLGDTGILFVVPQEKTEAFLRAGRNVQSASSMQAKSLNAYEVLRAKKVVLFESAVKTLSEHFTQ